MGFDDILYDNYLLQKTKKNCMEIISGRGVGTTYHYDQMGDAESLERNENTVCYNAYSLAFHMILPVIQAQMLGMCPSGKLRKGQIKFSKLRARHEAVECMIVGGYGQIEDFDSDSDSENGCDDPFDLDNVCSDFHKKLLELYMITDTQMSDFGEKDYYSD